jgi:hypothetical protein
VFTAESVERYVVESVDDLPGARIQTYRPLFVNRFVGDCGPSAITKESS